MDWRLRHQVRCHQVRWVIVMFFVALTLEPSRCGVPPINVRAAEFPPAIIISEGKTSQGFPYMFGGVSSNEREALEQRAKNYNLKLVFAEKNGAFLSGITVVMSAPKIGEFLSLEIDGPWFFIQLPPGTYGITANFRGQTRQINNLNVPKNKTVQHTFIWDLGEREAVRPNAAAVVERNERVAIAGR
jgi:hypothetical protein